MARPQPFTVVFDPDAVAEFVTAVKAKEERKAILNAVDKLRQVGDRLAPPHVKSLRGAPDLYELRPRQGRSDWRPVYARFGEVFVVLAIDRHDNFDALIARAHARAGQYRA